MCELPTRRWLGIAPLLLLALLSGCSGVGSLESLRPSAALCRLANEGHPSSHASNAALEALVDELTRNGTPAIFIDRYWNWLLDGRSDPNRLRLLCAAARAVDALEYPQNRVKPYWTIHDAAPLEARLPILNAIATSAAPLPATVRNRELLAVLSHLASHWPGDAAAPTLALIDAALAGEQTLSAYERSLLARAFALAGQRADVERHIRQLPAPGDDVVYDLPRHEQYESLRRALASAGYFALAESFGTGLSTWIDDALAAPTPALVLEVHDRIVTMPPSAQRQHALLRLTPAILHLSAEDIPQDFWSRYDSMVAHLARFPENHRTLTHLYATFLSSARSKEATEHMVARRATAVDQFWTLAVDGGFVDSPDGLKDLLPLPQVATPVRDAPDVLAFLRTLEADVPERLAPLVLLAARRAWRGDRGGRHGRIITGWLRWLAKQPWEGASKLANQRLADMPRRPDWERKESDDTFEVDDYYPKPFEPWETLDDLAKRLADPFRRVHRVAELRALAEHALRFGSLEEAVAMALATPMEPEERIFFLQALSTTTPRTDGGAK